MRSFSRFFGRAPNEELVKNKLDLLTARLTVYESILGKSKYLGGDVGDLLF